MDFEKERREALAAGRTALSNLEDARNMLSRARGWGIYDTFFKGGFVSGLIKHSRMRDAEACIDRARDSLIGFSNELRDLNLTGINLQTGDLIGLADIFCDSFLTDILMQGRIANACSQIDNAISRVRSLMKQLERM